MSLTPILDESYMISKIPMTYLREFKVDDNATTKKVEDVYTFDSTNFNQPMTITNTGDYNFNLFSMDISNDLFVTPLKTKSDYTINLTLNAPNTSNIVTALGAAAFNTIHSGSNITVQSTFTGINNFTNGSNITVSNDFKTNLSTLLKDNKAIEQNYDIINFQDITTSNIETVNSNLTIDTTIRPNLVRVSIPTNKPPTSYLTTYYKKDKFDLLGYYDNTSSNHVNSLVLYFKVPNDNRILIVENGISAIIDDNGLHKTIETDKIKLFNDDYIQHNIKTNNIVDIDKINDNKNLLNNDAKKVINWDFYKQYYIYCGKAKLTTSAPPALPEFINTSIKSKHYQNINEAKISNKFIVNSHNVILFDHNLEMEKPSPATTPPTFVNNFLTDIDETDFNNLKIHKYLGHSKSLGLGVNFSLAKDDFTGYT